MARSTIPKINVPSVEEIDTFQSESSSTNVVLKKNSFTRFRNNAGGSSKEIVEESSGEIGQNESTSSAKRKYQDDDSGNSVEKNNSASTGDISSFLFPESKKIVEPRASGSTIIVNSRQKGNPLLRFLRNVPYEFGQTAADYILGESCCGLFLSLKFHRLHPDYVHERLKEIGRSYSLQVLLVQVDILEPEQALRELNTICFNANWTLMLAWNPEEAAELLESYKIYENKPPDFLMGRQETDPRAKLIDLLTTIKSITRTDAENLIATFGSLKNMVEASEEQLAMCPGLGMKKAKRLYYAFGASWRYTSKQNDRMSQDSMTSEATTSSVMGTQTTMENEEDLFEPDAS